MGLWNRFFGNKTESGEDIQIILKKIVDLTRPQDMPEKIMMLYHALSLTQRQSNPELGATLQVELGNSFHLNSQGNRADNIEKAIEHYNQALEVYTPHDFPVQWAGTRNNLANAYSDRIKGDKAENIENAIEYFNQALEVRTHQDFPVQWAKTQNNLALAYSDRIRGDRAKNIERAIEHYNKALTVYTQKGFPVEWSTIQNNVALAYSDRIQGNKADNIEKAIDHFNQALEVRTKKNLPVGWAMTQNNMALAYIDRIQGNKANNIEKAIDHFNQALEVRTQNNFPVEWTGIRHNLGLAYRNRIRGERADNIEKAIEHFNKALEVRTQKDFPVDWAGTQNNLAVAYSSRVRGDRADNIEKAIEHYNRALKVRTQKDFPVDWAGTQNNLAVAYSSRIRGDRADNIEKAIKHFNQALEVRMRKYFPVDWAETQNNLGNTYNSRILGNKAENVEKAIEYFNQALDMYTRKNFLVDWAKTQNNIANAYSDHILGDRADNIEKAIEHYNKALTVYTLRDFPIDWAMTQNNLANAYRDRIKGDKAENVEQAIKHLNKSLRVRTRQDLPTDWAETQNNLALAYWNRLRGNQVENIENAISHCHGALRIYNLESTPNDFCGTCRFLGDLYLDMGLWENAMESYKFAIKADDLLYRSGLSAESKAIEVGENAHLYRNAVFAASNLGLNTKALLILEKGKTRLLSEALRLKMKKPENAPKEEWIKYERAAEKYRSSIKPYDPKEDYDQREKEVQNALEELDIAVKVIQMYNPEFQKELDISDILSIIDNETALLTFCITNKGSIGFVVSWSTGVQSVDIPGFKTEDLNRLLFQLDDQGVINGGWVGDYPSYLNALGTKHQENVFQAWQETLNEILSDIGSRLLNPLLAELPSQTKRLIFLPSGGLFLLPLHAVPFPYGEPLCQRYCISYAPSIQLLREMQNKARIAKGEDLYAVINPEEDPALIFSGFEGQTISKLFQSHQVDVGEIGTKATVLDRIPGRAYLHFSCHGSYNWNDPPQSGLYLVGGRTLSLADLQSDVVDMFSTRLVTLSACETGITDIVKGSADEFVGLPAGFMLAGVPCVVSSLWSVPDISAALLMERFYSNHVVGGMDIPMALQDAQLWVRDLTSSQVADYVEKCYQSGKWEGKSKEFIEQYRKSYLKIAKEFPDKKPFRHPYYWAAFTVNGA
ncbi:MAG: CHAT domain-containing protein [Methanosarcina barkeri]|nr:CHAT domain-containing protein [Methanosarcina sp. ERenArc_MAG2]